MHETPMELRAHHGMCLAFFEGKGYSDEFVLHMQSVLELLEKNPKIRITAREDIICGKCPNLKEGICSETELVQSYDRQVLALCEKNENTELDWNTFSALVKENILSPGKRETICGNCQWSPICKADRQSPCF